MFSKFDPLNIGDGEPGMAITTICNSNDNTPSSTSTSSNTHSKFSLKKKYMEGSSSEFKEVMDTIKKACGSDGASQKNRKIESFDDLTLEELYKMIDQHRNHLTMFKDLGMCDEEKAKSIVNKIKKIFDVINNKVEGNFNSKNVSSD